jgi:hypothetical protein
LLPARVKPELRIGAPRFNDWDIDLSADGTDAKWHPGQTLRAASGRANHSVGVRNSRIEG